MTTSERGPRDSIGSRIVSGLAWKAGSQVSLQLTRMVVALVLARMLAPHDWGLAAMVLAFSGFVVVFTDNALGTALIQRDRLFAGDRSTVFWISAALGLLLTLGGFAAAGPLASFYGEPEVQALFTVLAVTFFVSSLGTTQAALLIRDMQFRILELRLIAATLVGAGCAIAVAWSGLGAWAIVTQQLTEAVVSTTLLWWWSPWRPSFTFSWPSVRRLGRFAGNVFGENALYQAGRALGVLLIGRGLGAAALGAYALATTVVLLPFTRLGVPLQQVFLPAFSRMQDDRERMADIWIRVTRLVGAITIPALVGLVIVAPDFVRVVLGSRWEEAVPLIQILAWAALIQALQTLNGEVLLALNRSGTLLRFTMLWLVATVGAVALGLRWGLLGVAVSYTVAAIGVEFVRMYLTASALDVSVWRLVRALGGIAQAGAAMAVVVLVVRESVLAEVPPAARLVLLGALGAIVYIACCAWRAPEVTAEVRAALQRRRPVKAPAEAVIEI
jgi:O-antigen/teichoic acid export membrane protein